MKRDKFVEFWNKLSDEWYKTTMIKTSDGSNVVHVSELCCFSDNCANHVYKSYELIKQVIKDAYFKNSNGDDLKICRLSRYKRAAVLTYAIIKSAPLVFSNKENSLWVDPNFLKQRLAFYIAISSIIQDATDESIRKSIEQNGVIFDFASLGSSFNCDECQDDSFLLSIYKDLLFSEIYDNFNVLTMANVYGLLTEKTTMLEFNN